MIHCEVIRSAESCSRGVSLGRSPSATTSGPSGSRFSYNALALAFLALLSILLGSGCAKVHSDTTAMGDFAASNVYRSANRLPTYLRRVTVLPLTPAVSDWISDAGVEALQPVLLQEIIRHNHFEATFLSPAELRELTGKSSWRSEEHTSELQSRFGI